MSRTGLHLRRHARRLLARALDHLADVIDPAPPAAPPAAEPEPAPPPPASPPAAAAPAPPPPLPTLPTATTRDPGVVATPAARKAAESPEARQAAHWARTRSGLLRFVDEHGGQADLRTLHEHSERAYFVAHVQFSRMMEELTDEGLLDFDHDTGVASLTDAGRAELAG